MYMLQQLRGLQVKAILGTSLEIIELIFLSRVYAYLIGKKDI